MSRFAYYMDFGSGFSEIQPHSKQLRLGLRRGEFNVFIARKYLSGSFSVLHEDATDCYAYFITNGNEEIPFRIIENSIIKFDGYAKINGDRDNISNTFTFNSFRTEDQYSRIIPYLSKETSVETIPEWSGTVYKNRVLLQGLNTNSNKIKALSWSGSAFSETGNNLTLSNSIGRVCCSSVGSAFAVYDAATKELRRYTYSAPDWSLSALGTSLFLNEATGNASMCPHDNARIVFIDDFFNELRVYHNIADTWELDGSKQIEQTKFPSLAYVSDDYFALVDEGTQLLRLYNQTSLAQVGNPLSIGEILKPSICLLDSVNLIVAMVDSNTFALRAYQYASGEWTQIGSPLNVGGMVEPVIRWHSTNNIILYDQSLAELRFYNYSSGTWSQVGSSASLSAGYSNALGDYNGSIFFFLSSDSLMINSPLTNSFYGLLNGCLFKQGLIDYDYSFPSTSGATFDALNLNISDLGSWQDINYVPDNPNNLKLKINDFFDIAEVFQNYWYIQPGTSTYDIRFTQPDKFSLFGPDIDVSQYSYLNKKIFKDQFLIDRETIEFQNELNTDFVGWDIDYSRNTSNVEARQYNYTMDVGSFVNFYLGGNKSFEKSGIVLLDIAYNGVNYYVKAGTGISLETNVRNELYSKTRISDTYLKDYRYKHVGNFSLNDETVSVQNTVRDMIAFPTVFHKMSEFPDEIGSLDWGGGVKSFITDLNIDLNTYTFTIDSVLLDI